MESEGEIIWCKANYISRYLTFSIKALLHYKNKIKKHRQTIPKACFYGFSGCPLSHILLGKINSQSITILLYENQNILYFNFVLYIILQSVLETHRFFYSYKFEPPFHFFQAYRRFLPPYKSLLSLISLL